MSGADVGGCIGLALLVVFLIASLPWPTYRGDGWVDEATRRQNAERLGRDIDAARRKHV